MGNYINKSSVARKYFLVYSVDLFSHLLFAVDLSTVNKLRIILNYLIGLA
jgi:hypothetical protein